MDTAREHVTAGAAGLRSFWTFQGGAGRGAGRAGRLWDSKEGLSWTESEVPLQTVSWCCRGRARPLRVHLEGRSAALFPKEGVSVISVPKEGDAGWTFRDQLS